MTYQEKIIDHYRNCWEGEPKIYLWDKGPVDRLSSNFRVLEFAPSAKRNMWTYASCCLSEKFKASRIELHVHSAKQDDTIIELLTTVAYYHQNTSQLNLNNTINFGKSWQDKSGCTFGFISLPYLDGPTLENLEVSHEPMTKFYWLIPVTEREVDYKSRFGVEALETKFDQFGINYIDAKRLSLV